MGEHFLNSKVFTFNENDIISFKKTPNYKKHLLPRINELIDLGRLSESLSDKIIRYKAEEYKIFTQNDKASKNLYHLLLYCYEAFEVIEYLIDPSVVKKYFLVINKQSKFEFEKILKSEDLFLDSKEFIVTDEKSILIYSGSIQTTDKDPYLSSCLKADQSGMKVGCYYYSGKDSHHNGVGFLYENNSRFSISEFSKEDQSKAKGGYREDLNSGFKSSWEANIARILNSRNLKWYYEYFYIQVPQSIYEPDFYFSSEGDEIILEVKGMWDSRSIEKMAYMIREESDYMLIIVDTDLYRFLDNKYNHLPNWEKNEVPNGKYTLPVLGVNIENRRQHINALEKGEEIFLLREPNNPYDSYAIKVMNKEGKDLGYIKKEWAAIFSWKMDFGFKYKSVVHSNEIKGSSFQIKLSAYYDNTAEHQINESLIKYHLYSQLDKVKDD